MLCIGLFGTCDKNRWRDSFIAKYEELGIPYFNPMVDNWHAGLVPIEAKHLTEDEIIMFPILGWSYAEGGLSEIGFGPLKALSQGIRRSFVFFIETNLHERLTDSDRCKASLRSRNLVIGHLKELNATNIYLVKNLEQALKTTIDLYDIHKKMNELQLEVRTTDLKGCFPS